MAYAMTIVVAASIWRTGFCVVTIATSAVPSDRMRFRPAVVGGEVPEREAAGPLDAQPCFCHLEKTLFPLDRDDTVYGSRGCVEPSKSAAQPLLMHSVLERASDPLR